MLIAVLALTVRSKPVIVVEDAVVNQAYVAVVRDAIKTTTITTVEIIKPFFFIVFLLIGIKPLSKKLYPFFIFLFCLLCLVCRFPRREIATLTLAMTRWCVARCAVISKRCLDCGIFHLPIGGGRAKLRFYESKPETLASATPKRAYLPWKAEKREKPQRGGGEAGICLSANRKNEVLKTERAAGGDRVSFVQGAKCKARLRIALQNSCKKATKKALLRVLILWRRSRDLNPGYDSLVLLP